MIKELTSTDALVLETIADDIKSGLNAVFAICGAMEYGNSSASGYADGLYFVYYALAEKTKKLFEVIGISESEADQ